jgi:hypothetical protein
LLGHGICEVAAMHHEPPASLDELLAPETLTRLCHERVSSVVQRPFSRGHSASGSNFLAVETNDGHGPMFVVKLSSPATDWIVRGTADLHGREMLVWARGLLDQLPPEITHPVLACARDGAGWAILMRDVSEDLFADAMGETPISQGDHWRYLDALAALHAKFWDQTERADPALGFCTPWHRYTIFSPATGEREATHPNEVVRWIQEGWDLFWTLVEPEVASLVRQLLADPAPLCAAMARYPQTLVHGDPRGSNLGIEHAGGSRVILIDWQLAGPGAAGEDVAWYLANLGIQAPVANDISIAWYRDSLAQRLGTRFDEAWWQPQIELSLLGELVRLGWGHGWDAEHHPSRVIREWTRADLDWWCDRARAGARWL